MTSTPTAAPSLELTTPTTDHTGARDFDFLMGPWHIRNTRLMQRLTGCTEWETFDATGYARPLPGGIGNYDDFIASTWKPGYVGMSLRVFNPAAQRWSIYWLDNATGGVDAATGLLQPPVVGGFADGKGIFNGRDVLGVRPILVQFEWSLMHTGAPRWQQSFSADEGQTWEVNWVMEFTRRCDRHSSGVLVWGVSARPATVQASDWPR